MKQEVRDVEYGYIGITDDILEELKFHFGLE
jgi:hypothetical protein